MEPVADFRAIVRHVYFHTFHIRLKSIGTSLMVKNNLRRCDLDSSCRNMIPELPESFKCQWDECDVGVKEAVCLCAFECV